MLNLQRNSVPFSEIVKGARGRKIAYTNVDSITPDNVVQVVGSCWGIFEKNKIATAYLWRYLHGDQPILYKKKDIRPEINSKVEINRAEEIVKFKNGQTYGEPVQYVCRGKDDIKKTEAVDRLNSYMEDAGKHEKDITHGEWQSATGTSFLAVQMQDNEEIPFSIIVPTPLDTFIIYNKRTQKPLLAVQECADVDGTPYKLCYSSNMQFVIKNGVLDNYGLHTFGGIPIVEYPNNAERVSDVEIVIDLLDAMNETQSDRIDGIKQFVQALMVFKNCAIDEETFTKLRQAGALSIKSTREMDSSVDMLTQELSQQDTQTVLDDMWDAVQSILGIPSKQGNTGGDSQGAVELRNGWDFSKQRAKLKDPYVVNAEKQLVRIVLTLIKRVDNEMTIGVRDFDVKINHSPTDNLLVKTQALQNLLSSGVDAQSSFASVGLFSDSEKVFLASKNELDVNYYQKAVSVLSQMLSTGISVDEACKLLGFNANEIDKKRWNTSEELNDV